MRRRKKKVDAEALPTPKQLGIVHDPLNEIVLLAAACVDEKALELTQRLPGDHFFGKGHAALWVALGSLRRKGLEFDWDTLAQLAGPDVDVDYLRDLVEERPNPPPNLKHHVAMLEWDRTRVEAVRGPLQGLLKSLKSPTSSPEETRSYARAVGASFDHSGGQRYLRDPQELVRSTMDRLRERREGVAIYPFGLPGLDYFDDGAPRMIPGMKPGKVTLLVGVPGSGKSTLAARIALGQAGLGEDGGEPRRGLYAPWEPGDEDTLELMSVMSLGWSRSQFSTGKYSDEQLEVIRERMELIATHIRFLKMPFGKARGSRSNNDQRLDVIQGVIQDTGAEWAAFDLWKRCLRQTDPGEVELALNRQQAICEETMCHGLLLHQLRAKEVEQREDKRPTREGIKGSGAWIEVPDNIIGVHRPALWSGCDDDVVELVILKQRWGKWPLAVEFDWDGDRGSFESGREIPYDAPSTRKETESQALEDFIGDGKKRKR